MKFAFVLQHTYSGPVELRLNGSFIAEGTKEAMQALKELIIRGIVAGLQMSLDEKGAY